MPELWAGTDAGKAAHHCTVIDTDGTKVLSRRVPDLLELATDRLWTETCVDVGRGCCRRRSVRWEA
ncbi:hypothetical protein GCM10010345_85940 [Streptomyces canarius]|uniref:Transposase IS111A/IS1328/IS1533 N-terminal domain-containing protein n=1 Tax=Streptomyces canarius TaxID=285453 RepID=A0ABQ3DBA3_9ACTN|nr:hypothetical protein GCM10010345_85940 [Streptomyces canarius]